MILRSCFAAAALVTGLVVSIGHAAAQAYPPYGAPPRVLPLPPLDDDYAAPPGDVPGGFRRPPLPLPLPFPLDARAAPDGHVPGQPVDRYGRQIPTDPGDATGAPGRGPYAARPPYSGPPPGVADPDDDRVAAPAPPYGTQPGYGPPPTYSVQPLPPPPPAYGAQPQPGYAAQPPDGTTPPGYGAPRNYGAPPGYDGQANPRPPSEVDPRRQQTVASLPPEYQPDAGETKELPQRFRRQLVEYRSKEPAGTLIIDTPNTYLYLLLGHGQAMRYGIGVGREGFTWAGIERISRMQEWPDWNPPSEMIERQPYLPRFMAGGPGNPLGARALYLGKTLYRIHGTNQPSTIGTFVSSGCIRLFNEDIEDLYGRVNVGTRVMVLPGGKPATAGVAR